MIDYGCPRCNGALYVESFKTEGKTFIEITCIMCSRIWTPQTITQLLASVREAGYTAKADRIKRMVDAAVMKERGASLVT